MIKGIVFISLFLSLIQHGSIANPGIVFSIIIISVLHLPSFGRVIFLASDCFSTLQQSWLVVRLLLFFPVTVVDALEASTDFGETSIDFGGSDVEIF